jgi:hypothetical protein
MTFFSTQTTRKDEVWTQAELRMLGRALKPSRKAETPDLGDAMPWHEEGDTESKLESEFELLDEFIDKICSRAIVLKRHTEAKEDEIDGKRAIFSGLLAAAIFIFWFYSKLST